MEFTATLPHSKVLQNATGKEDNKLLRITGVNLMAEDFMIFKRQHPYYIGVFQNK